jgi:hypothetical protein
MRRSRPQRSIASSAAIFVAASLGIGIASYGSSGSLGGAILIGSLGGALAALLIGRFDRSASARLEALGLRDGNYPARLSAVAAVRADSAAVFAACETAVKSLPNFGTITRHDRSELVLHCRTRRSTQSWGENITINLEQSGTLTTLHVKSEPVLWTVTEDMRFNYQNVALVLREIGRRFSVESIQPSEYFLSSIAGDTQQ